MLAGGPEINFQGIRQMGMGYTGTATLMGSSSIYYNPGGLSFQTGKFHFQGGSSIVAYNGVYYDAVSGITARTEDRYLYPYNGYTDVKLAPFMSFGVGVYNSLGTDVHWEPLWKGRFLLQNSTFTTQNIQPTISVKFSKYFGLGLGVAISNATLRLSRDLPFTNASGVESFANLSGKANEVGYNIGLFVKPTDKLNIGVTYRTGPTYSFRDCQVILSVPQETGNQYPPVATFNSDYQTANTLTFGAAWQATRKFLVTGDVGVSFWSAVKKTEINFDNTTERFQNIDLLRNYKNTTTVRLGAQYVESCCLSFRAGVAYEQSPLNKQFAFPDMVDSDRFSFTAGFSYDFDDHWAVDLAAGLIENKQINANYAPLNFSGTYKSRTVTGSAGLTYTF